MYLGEIAFADLKLIDTEKIVQGRESYILLIEKYPNIPLAFIKLCIHDKENHHYSHSLDTIGKVYDLEAVRNLPELEV